MSDTTITGVRSMAHAVKAGFIRETREPDRVIIADNGVKIRIFMPDIDEAERKRREREYLRVAMEIHQRRALEALQAGQPEPGT